MTGSIPITLCLCSMHLRPLRQSLVARLIEICTVLRLFVSYLCTFCLFFLSLHLHSNIWHLQYLTVEEITQWCDFVLHGETLSCQQVLWMMKVKM